MKAIFLSNQLFDFPLKTNKWHVATRVAERGHEVLFVDPPIRLRKLVKQVFEGRWPLWRIFTGFYAMPVSGCHSELGSESNVENPNVKIQMSNKAPNPKSKKCLGFWALDFIGILGFGFWNFCKWILNRVQDGDNRPVRDNESYGLAVFTPLTLSFSESPNLTDFNIRRMRNQFPDFFDGSAVLWVYNPAMDEYVEKIPHRLLIYDCVDDYPSMANYIRLGLSREIAAKEDKITRKADVVFATTRHLARKLSRYNNNVHYVGNAGDYERFAPVGKARLSERSKRVQPSRGLNPLFGTARGRNDGVWKRVEPWEGLNPIGRPRIGFTGAIDEYKLNLPLLAKIAKAYPAYSLVLVGPQGVADSQPDLSELKKLPNVHFIGPQPYEEMPKFFAGFDCYIIPYNLNNYTLKGCFPVKFFDALAAGLPTIVSNLPAFGPFADVCYIGGSDEEFISLIGKALEEDSPEKIKVRMQIAQRNSWEKKVERMLNIIYLRRQDDRMDL